MKCVGLIEQSMQARFLFRIERRDETFATWWLLNGCRSGSSTAPVSHTHTPTHKQISLYLIWSLHSTPRWEITFALLWPYIPLQCTILVSPPNQNRALVVNWNCTLGILTDFHRKLTHCISGTSTSVNILLWYEPGRRQQVGKEGLHRKPALGGCEVNSPGTRLGFGYLLHTHMRHVE